jgi:amino acid adenylation domain-containing protein
MNDLSDVKRRLLEQMLAGTSEPAGTPAALAIVRHNAVTAPLSAEQAHVWLHASMAPSLPLYNEPVTIHRHGGFDLATLRLSLGELLRRHEIWRTSFARIEGEIRQVIHPEIALDLPLIDLSALPRAEREAEAVRIATQEARRPFDLAEAPLFRVTVLKLASDEHRLHFTLHHIIFDGVSIYRIVVPELSAIYAAFAEGHAPDLPAPALQYADYTLWREARLAGPEIARQIEYWRQKLAGEPEPPQLPYDRPRPPIISYRGAMEVFGLSPALTLWLKTLARREGVTLYMVLLAAFKALLFRYSDQEDILIGGVTDLRRRPELEKLVGYFLDTIVLRTTTRGDMSFRDYLAETRKTVVEALEASEVPFDWVVRELRPRRDASTHPFFQILFSMEPPAPAFAPGWDLTQMEISAGTAKFDLYLELDERLDGIIARFLYNSALFDPATIRRMIGHWTRLLEAVVADPSCPLARLPILGRDEETRLLVDWNMTRQPYPELCLHDWIARQAAATPDAVALKVEDEAWTYRRLMHRAHQIAARLGAEGVGPETLVAVALERSADLVASLIGIMLAGGAYLPLDPAFPAARLQMILDEAKPAVLLTQRDLVATLPASGARLLLCEECDGDPGPPDGTEPSPDRLAYVLYTSGSTGRPKGVEITHRALVNLLAAMQREPGFSATDSLLAVTTISFDIAGLELYLPLVSGGTLVLANRAAAADPVLLAEAIRRSGCTMLQATPAGWRALVEAGWPGAAQLKMLCGGEALPRELADQLLGRGSELWNLYGPTETTIWSCIQRVLRGTGTVPIGRPIANTTIYILDRLGRPVPAGLPGALHIGGVGLARGYRDQAALTAERFAAAEIAGDERLYRTGDIARYCADGSIEWLGRSDDQVKIRGFRIELGEVEAALATHPSIAAAAVRVWPDAAGLPSLAAYVVPRGTETPDPAELRRFLQQFLPDYMIPGRLIDIAALPMTPNGKIDRNALPKPESAIQTAERLQPEGETECRLAALWQEVLGLPSVGAQEDFFMLGGHSLLATRLLRRIEEVFGMALPLVSIFQAPTVRRLALLIGETAVPAPRRWTGFLGRWGRASRGAEQVRR